LTLAHRRTKLRRCAANGAMLPAIEGMPDA
jgi:hypothetical protein